MQFSIRTIRRIMLSITTGITFTAVGSAMLTAQPGWAQYEPPGDPTTMERQQKAILAYQRAVQCFQSGDFTSCVKLCNAVLNVDHNNKNANHLKALAYGELGDPGNAIAAFRTALNIDANFVQCRNNYGMFLKKTGNTKEAENMFVQCIRINPKYPDAYYHLGEIMKEKADLDLAIENFETAVRLNPNYFEAQRDLGLAIYEKVSQNMTSRSVTDSIEALKKAARLAPDNPLIWYHLGRIYCADGNLDVAEDMFRMSLAKDAKVAAAHWELGRLRYLRGDPDRCLTELKIAQKVSPVYTESKEYPKVDPLDMNKYLGACYQVKEDYGDAADCYREVASLTKDNADILKHVAKLAKMARSDKKPVKDKNAPVFDPQAVQALITRGLNQLEDHDYQAARQSFEQALNLNPNSFEAMQNLGASLEKTGDLNGAMAQYQEAMQLVPQFAGVYYNMAYCLEKAHLNADAGQMYKKFHDLTGRYPYDPRHIVALQQEDIRLHARDEALKKRGY